jgi:membrane protease YdiL (CAAX protease family)
VKWRTSRSIGFAFVADAAPGPNYTRLAFWSVFVAAIAALNYYARFSGSSSSQGSGHVSLYSYSTFAGGMLIYAIWLGVVLLICIDRFDLLALRPPDSWGRALRLAVLVIVAIWAWEAIVSRIPLPQSPGREQGITTVHWEPAHAGAFAANVVLFAAVAPFVEELTFRGAGQSLLRFLGSTPSILIVGTAFGLTHGLVEALLILIPFGIALAWLRDRTESVVPGMFVHALFNGAALAAAVLVT